MSKTPKVVPIEEPKRRLVAADEKTNRYILQIGSDRVAFDFTTRVTRLSPSTGDQPAEVVALSTERPKRRRKRNTSA
jgi:hypothetical protein